MGIGKGKERDGSVRERGSQLERGIYKQTETETETDTDADRQTQKQLNKGEGNSKLSNSVRERS